MTPSALEKAKSLTAYIKQRGAHISEFQLAVSPAEALELLDWLLSENPGNELLEEDVAEAHLTNDPWSVLIHFNLMGLSVVPKAILQ